MNNEEKDTVMNIEVGGALRITNPTPWVKQYIAKELVLTNPEWLRRQRQGLYVGKTPRYMPLFDLDGDVHVLPYGTLRTILENTDNCSVTNTFVEQATLDYECEIPLYDYQERAVNEAVEAYYGILQAPAGSGKTQMGIAIAARLGKRCLWLVHTKDLLLQGYNRAAAYMNPNKLGTIYGGKVELGTHITFATIQSMSNLDLTMYKDTFDTIIVDEVHRVAINAERVTRYRKVLNNLRARHKYGLSATLSRADGLIGSTFALMGNVVAKVEDDEVNARVMPVKILPIPTHMETSPKMLSYDGTIDYVKTVGYQTFNDERNDLIAKWMIANKDHYNLVLVDRVAHFAELIKRLPKYIQQTCVVVDGTMTSKKAKVEREMAIEAMRKRKKHFLIATFQLAKEGLDIPALDRLFLCIPHSHESVVEQTIGRIARKCEGKADAIAFDFVDPYDVRGYKMRCRTYRRKKCIFLQMGDKELVTHPD